MDILKRSFVRYGCLKQVLCYECLKNMSFVCYECLKDVFCTLWMSQICLLYVMDVSNMSWFKHYSQFFLSCRGRDST